MRINPIQNNQHTGKNQRMSFGLKYLANTENLLERTILGLTTSDEEILKLIGLRIRRQLGTIERLLPGDKYAISLASSNGEQLLFGNTNRLLANPFDGKITSLSLNGARYDFLKMSEFINDVTNFAKTIASGRKKST